MYSRKKIPGSDFRFCDSSGALCGARPQEIEFDDFFDGELTLNGSTLPAIWQSNHVLRLTKGNFATSGSRSEAGSTFFNVKQPVASGFTSYFAFQLHNPTSLTGPGDGIAFVLQNSSTTNSSMELVARG